MRRQALIAALFTLIGFVSSLAISILTARLLGPEGRGNYGVIFLWASTLANCATLGIADAAAVRATRERAADASLSAMMHRSLATQIIVLGAVILPGVAIFSAGISLSGTTVDVRGVLVCACFIIFSAFSSVFQGFHRAASQYIRYNLNRILLFTTLAILLLCLGSIHGGALSLETVLTALILSQTLALAIGSVIALPLLRGGVALTNADRSLLSAGLSMHAPTIVYLISMNVDRFLAAGLMDPLTFGQYSVAASVAQPSAFIFVIVIRVIMITDGQLQIVTRASQRLSKYVGVVLLGSLATTLTAGIIITVAMVAIFGSAFAPAAPLALWLLLGYLLSPIRAILGEYHRLTHSPHLNIVIELTYSVIFAALMLALPSFPHHGEYGLALLAGNCVALTVGIWLTRITIRSYKEG